MGVGAAEVKPVVSIGSRPTSAADGVCGDRRTSLRALSSYVVTHWSSAVIGSTGANPLVFRNFIRT